MDAWNGRVVVDDKEYKVEWVHERLDDCRDLEVLQLPFRARTGCFLSYESTYDEDKQAWTSCAVGHADCSWSDNFSRKVGRKLSLQRALLDSDFTEHQRRQVWWQVLAIKGLVR